MLHSSNWPLLYPQEWLSWTHEICLSTKCWFQQWKEILWRLKFPWGMTVKLTFLKKNYLIYLYLFLQFNKYFCIWVHEWTHAFFTLFLIFSIYLHNCINLIIYWHNYHYVNLIIYWHNCVNLIISFLCLNLVHYFLEIKFQHEKLHVDLDLKNNMIQGLALSSNGLLCGLILK